MSAYAKSSPILALAKCVPDALLKIAPERSEDTVQLIAQYNVRPVLDDREGFRFSALPNDLGGNDICVSVQGLEVVWSASFAYWVLYTAAKHAQAGGATELALYETPATKAATGLLRWAVRNVVLRQRVPWPDDLPKPPDCTAIPLSDNEYVANDVALAAAGWILHHELAHLRHEHPLVTAYSMPEEQQADATATSWLLDEVTDAGVIMKRGIGIVVAILSLAIQELHAIEPTKAGVPRTHPRLADRLFRALSHQAFGDDHQVFELPRSCSSCTSTILISIRRRARMRQHATALMNIASRFSARLISNAELRRLTSRCS